MHSEPDDLTVSNEKPSSDKLNLEAKKKRKRSKPRQEKLARQQPPYNLVPEFMPRETINGQSIPKPRSDLFKKKDEIVD